MRDRDVHIAPQRGVETFTKHPSVGHRCTHSSTTANQTLGATSRPPLGEFLPPPWRWLLLHVTGGNGKAGAGSRVATTRGSPTSGQKPAVRGRIPVTAIVTWWWVSTNTASRAGPCLSQPSHVPKPQVKPQENPPMSLAALEEVTSDGMGPSRLQVEDPTGDQTIALPHADAAT